MFQNTQSVLTVTFCVLLRLTLISELTDSSFSMVCFHIPALFNFQCPVPVSTGLSASSSTSRPQGVFQGIIGDSLSSLSRCLTFVNRFMLTIFCHFYVITSIRIVIRILIPILSFPSRQHLMLSTVSLLAVEVHFNRFPYPCQHFMSTNFCRLDVFVKPVILLSKNISCRPGSLRLSVLSRCRRSSAAEVHSNRFPYPCQHFMSTNFCDSTP